MCNFDKNGACYALGCYSLEKCGARDIKGNPKYADIGESNNRTGMTWKKAAPVQSCDHEWKPCPAAKCEHCGMIIEF